MDGDTVNAVQQSIEESHASNAVVISRPPPVARPSQRRAPCDRCPKMREQLAQLKEKLRCERKEKRDLKKQLKIALSAMKRPSRIPK